jgi:RNA polymerase sigma-70 factor, ECF subfamily
MFDFEESFIELLVAWDEQAFAAFYEKTVDAFNRYLMGRYFLDEATTQDILSDVYLKCWKWLSWYNPDYSFETYARSILKNHAKDYFKKRKSIQLKDEHMEDHSFISAGEDELLDSLEQDFYIERIEWVMMHLDETSYEVVYLKYMQELSYEEISTLTGISSDALRQRLSRALKKIKTLLQAP